MSARRYLSLFLGPAAIVAAVLLAVLLNYLAARHYKRFDWTEGKRYTLSPATVETLHGLSTQVNVYVILGGRDPLLPSVRQLLDSYGSQTSRLEVRYVDPDQDLVMLVELQKRFDLIAERTEDGRIATDAIVIVTQGDKSTFLTLQDMFSVVGGDQPAARPREEQAITGAIRTVTRSGGKARLCFTSGHGEAGLLPSRDDRVPWIGELKSVLERDMYTVADVNTIDPKATEPFKECDVVVIAGLGEPFSKDEAERLKAFLLGGGSALLGVGPITAPAGPKEGLVPAGLDEVLAPFGVGLDERLIVDTNSETALDKRLGVRFVVEAKPHPVTESLVSVDVAQKPPRIALNIVRPLLHVAAEGAPAAIDLLETGPKAYGLTDVRSIVDWTEPQERGSKDPAGPLVVGMASERPKVSASAPHGPRVVVLGSGSPFYRQSFVEPRPLRGATFLVENALSWLASRPQVLDVPERPSVAAGARVTPADVTQVAFYTLLCWPLAALLLGLAVFLRRRSTEGETKKPTS